MENCKICLDPISYGTNLSEQYNESLVYRDLLVACMPTLRMAVKNEDCICGTCQYNLEISYKFKSLCDDFAKTLESSEVISEDLGNDEGDKTLMVLYSGDVKKSKSLINLSGSVTKIIDYQQAEDKEPKKICNASTSYSWINLIKCEKNNLKPNVKLNSTANVRKISSLLSKTSIRGQKKTRNVKKNLKCVHCLKRFPTMKLLKRHFKKVEYPLCCKVCRCVLETKRQLYLHCKMVNCSKRICKIFRMVGKTQRLQDRRKKRTRETKSSASLSGKSKRVFKLEKKSVVSVKKTKSIKLSCRMCELLINRIKSGQKLMGKRTSCRVNSGRQSNAKKPNHQRTKNKKLQCGLCFKKFNTEEKFRLHSLMHISYYNKCRCSYCGVSLRQVLEKLSRARVM